MAEAHKTACIEELSKAESLHLENEYVDYLKASYPGKYEKMMSWVENLD